MAESLAEFFLANFRAHRKEPAYGQRRGYRMEWWSYGQVVDGAFRFVRELEACAIGKGVRVMLWGENCAPWVAAFFGCAMRGAIVVPMDHGASADFATRVLWQVEGKLLVCSRRHAHEQAGGMSPAPPSLVLEDFAQELGHHSASPVPNAALGRDDILQIVFTSGTTADPKGVVSTHGNMLANIEPFQQRTGAYGKFERWVHPIRFLNLLPMSHVFGQFLGMFLPPLLGGTVIFQEELKPSEIMSTIRRERVSVLVSVPRVLQSLKRKIERGLEDRGEAEEFRRRFRAGAGKPFLRRGGRCRG